MNIKNFEDMKQQEKWEHVQDLSDMGLVMTAAEKRYLNQVRR